MDKETRQRLDRIEKKLDALLKTTGQPQRPVPPEFLSREEILRRAGGTK